MYFESEHSFSENEFALRAHKFLDFPLHIQRSFEYFVQISGMTQVRVGDQIYLLKSGEAILVFPLQPHSYTCIEEGKSRLCIFSPEIVSGFYKSIENKIPANSKFRYTLPENIDLDNIFQKKAVAYLICGNFEKECEYIDKSNRLGDQMLVSLLLYTNRNFRNRCLLRDAAAEIGYDYAYISKFFKNKIGMSFRQYVNYLRINESKQLLKYNSKKISEISEECGFNSIRDFDREFFRQTGMTPSAYIKENVRYT